MLKTAGYILILGGLSLLLTSGYIGDKSAQIPLLFSSKTVLSGTWYHYKQNYWDETTGRTIDPQRNNVTTSEGQAYTLLRAVWMDDQETFDMAWSWTKENLGRPEDSLFSWLYGTKPDGTIGILTELSGRNSASDADTDIALALLFAGSRWNDPRYIAEAKEVLTDIWEKEVVTAGGMPVLSANDIEKFSSSPDIVLNPSYFAPYAYRIFAEVDPEHEWELLVESSYRIIQSATLDSLDQEKSAGLPPDWVTINRRTGEINKYINPALSTNYGYEAMRLPFRLALDWEWFKDPRAKNTLSLFRFLRGQWMDQDKIYAIYSHDGEIREYYESAAIYGGSIGYFIVNSPETGRDIFQNKLQSLYNPAYFDWNYPLGYYDTNWAWFGIALYFNELPNLYAYNSPTAVRASKILLNNDAR